MTDKERKLFRAMAAWAVASTKHANACEIADRLRTRSINYRPESLTSAELHVYETHETLSRAEEELLNAFSDWEGEQHDL